MTCSTSLSETGTTLFLYTDGLSEAMDADEQLFEKSGIRAVLRQAIADGQLSPQPLIQRMREAVEAFVGEAEQSDDLTILAIQRLDSVSGS